MWDHDEALAWLYARQALGIKLGLDKVRSLMAAVGDPHAAFRSVHVAGTNGKGSVVRFLAAALQDAGHRTGAFTSPHLIRFTERITVDGQEITQAGVARGLDRLRPAVEALDKQGTPPTFFEISTALAFMHFQDAGVEWAVVETGMGGRLDATNVIRPDLSVITSIESDHESFLGDGIDAIAAEKAGIMKPHVPCVTAARGEGLKVLLERSQGLQVPMSIVGEDYVWLPDLNGMRLAHPGGEAHYDVAAAGEHQLENAATAVAACDALRAAGVHLPLDSVQRALASTEMPGRLESFLHETPAGRKEVLLDGAHNLSGAHMLRYHLGRRDEAGFQLVVGFSTDKPWRQMLDQWVPLAAHVHLSPLRSKRGTPPEQLADYLQDSAIPSSIAKDLDEALSRALSSGSDLVVVAGSLFLVGEARAWLQGQHPEALRGDQ